jgi:hypothetical protein
MGSVFGTSVGRLWEVVSAIQVGVGACIMTLLEEECRKLWRTAGRGETKESHL